MINLIRPSQNIMTIIFAIFFHFLVSCQTSTCPKKITYSVKTKHYWSKDTLACTKELNISKGEFHWKDCFWDNDSLITTNLIPYSFVRHNKNIYLKYYLKNVVDSNLYYSLSRKDTLEILNIHDLTFGAKKSNSYSVFLGEQKYDKYDVFVFKIFEGKILLGERELWSDVQTTIYIEKNYLYPVKAETSVYKLTNQKKREDAFEILEIEQTE